MNAQQLNFIALANTARECAGIANSVSGTMAWIVQHWNLCCQQAGLINFTTEARYTRRAQLAADMMRMAAQLDNLANGCDALTGEKPEVQAVEAAPVVAEPTAAETMQITFWGANDYTARRAIVEAAHAEALTINEEIDAIISYAGDRAPVQMDGDMNCVFNTAVSVWRRRDVAEARLASDVLLCIKHDTANAVEACHAEALILNATFDTSFHRRAANWGAMDWFSREVELERAHAEALTENAQRQAYAPAPAADIGEQDTRALHSRFEEEDGKPYAAKVVTRAYIARSIARTLESHAKQTDPAAALWMAEHEADRAYRNSVITGEEFTALYHMFRAENAQPLAILEAMRGALLAGLPVMETVTTAAA